MSLPCYGYFDLRNSLCRANLSVHVPSLECATSNGFPNCMLLIQLGQTIVLEGGVNNDTANIDKAKYVDKAGKHLQCRNCENPCDYYRCKLDDMASLVATQFAGFLPWPNPEKIGCGQQMGSFFLLLPCYV